MEKQDDQDDQEAQYSEDAEEEGDASTHATFVADPAETTNPQGEREDLGKDESDEPGEDEGEDGGDKRDEKTKKRKPNTCLPQANQSNICAPCKETILVGRTFAFRTCKLWYCFIFYYFIVVVHTAMRGLIIVAQFRCCRLHVYNTISPLV